MALAPIREVILGSVAFAVFWVLAVFPGVPFLPIGRTAGSILGAVLMVIFKVITPEQAYNAIDLSVLGLLFGTMVVSIYLERADMFKYLGILFSWKNQGAKDLLCRICIVAAISSALFTNDTTCVVLTEFILEIASKNNVPPHPFLLALASSANIGSSATPIGNPQNLIIAIQSGISFGEFVLGLLPAMLVGIAVNAAILICMYWTLLSTVKDEEIVSDEVVYEEGAASHRVLPVAMSPPAMNSQNCSSKSKSSPRDSRILVEGTSETDMCGVSSRESESKELNVSKEKKGEDAITHIVAEMEEKIAKGGVQGSLEPTTDIESGPQQSDREKNCLFIHIPKKIIWKACIYLVTIGMLIAFLMGLNMSWTALAAALIFVVIDFKDAGPSLEKVSYSLLVFFCGMFISVDGFNRTGIPSTLWTLTEPHARINQVSGITVLAIVILILSNVASNVPTVLLLGASVAASAAAISPSEGKKAWLILAWVSTVAGNFSLLGSAANLIVCEQARRAKSSHTLSFWSHLKFGIPSTLVVTAVGLTLIEVNLTLISTWLFSMKFTVLQSL